MEYVSDTARTRTRNLFRSRCTVAYLGFHKGANFLWPLVLTQRGPNQVFQIFSYVKTFFGHGPMPPPPLNTPLQVHADSTRPQWLYLPRNFGQGRPPNWFDHQNIKIESSGKINFSEISTGFRTKLEKPDGIEITFLAFSGLITKFEPRINIIIHPDTCNFVAQMS